MLKRINELLDEGVDFALETTLATKSYVSFIKKAQAAGYKVTLLYFWLSSPQMAYDRVAKRVSKGGHNIPQDVIERRYYGGIKNLLKLYIPVCDNWIVFDNGASVSEIVAEGATVLGDLIIKHDIWDIILKQGNDD